MRALLASVLLLLLSLRPLAGAAFCLRHHAAQDGAACEAAMQMDRSGAGHDMQIHQNAITGAGDTPPMADECASAMVCAAPAPVVTGAVAALAFNPQLLLSEVRPAAAHRADAPATPFFRPPIA